MNLVYLCCFLSVKVISSTKMKGTKVLILVTCMSLWVYINIKYTYMRIHEKDACSTNTQLLLISKFLILQKPSDACAQEIQIWDGFV